MSTNIFLIVLNENVIFIIPNEYVGIYFIDYKPVATRSRAIFRCGIHFYGRQSFFFKKVLGSMLSYSLSNKNKNI